MGTIDPAGRVRGTLPLYTQATSYTGFNFIADQTFYTKHGDWFPRLWAVLAAGYLRAYPVKPVRLRRRRNSRERNVRSVAPS